MQLSDRYFQGQYHPTNPQKYCGSKLPIFRSGWEKAFFEWCDAEPKVVKWGSEIIEIPYQIPLQKVTHKYITDAYVEMRNGSRFVVEIKPFKQTQPPVKPKTNNWKAARNYLYALGMWRKNVSKWKAATAYCQSRGMKFMLLTEHDLAQPGQVL